MAGPDPFALLVSYPLVVVSNVLSGAFFTLAMTHLGVLAAFGTVYFFDTRHLPASQRVHPLWFLSLGIIMPVTYVLYTPLALFTLDSSSWETRGHSAEEPPPDDQSIEALAMTGANPESLG